MRLVPASSRELASSSGSFKLNTPVSSTFEAAISSEIELYEQKTKNTKEVCCDAKNSDGQQRAGDDSMEALEEASRETQVEHVDKVKLEEGYRLFGSLFSLIENEMQADTQKLEMSRRKNSADAVVAARFKKSVASHSSEDAAGAGKTGSVVLDFMKASSRQGARVDGIRSSLKNSVSVSDILDSGNKFGEKKEVDGQAMKQNSIGVDAVSVDENAVAPELIDASPTKSRISENQQNHGVDGHSDRALPVFSSQRVEQIVRTVVEQAPQTANVSSAAFAVESRVTGQMLRLSLHPVELGAVDITILRRGRRLEVKIVPELESTGKVLLGDAKELMESLGLASVDGDLVRLSIATNGAKSESGHDGDMLNTFVNQHEHSNAGDGRSGKSRTQTAFRPVESNSNDQPEPDIIDTPALGVRHHGLYI
jgi:hypothetical protein